MDEADTEDAVIDHPLTAREVCQVLRDIALQTRVMRRVEAPASASALNHTVTVKVDGWVLELSTSDGALAYCQSCQSPDGRAGSCETWQRYGSDPVQWLSTWELEQVRRLLIALD